MNIDKKLVADQYMEVIAFVGKQYYPYRAKDQEQFKEFIKILRQAKTIEELKKGIAYTIDNVPSYIRKRAGEHYLGDYNRAKRIYDACEFLHPGDRFNIPNAIIIGYELGREYERKAAKIIKALDGSKIGKKPNIKVNREFRTRILESLPLHYQKVKKTG